MDASAGAGKLLGIPMRQDDRSVRLTHLLEPNKLHYTQQRSEVLPGRHVLVLNDDSGRKARGSRSARTTHSCHWIPTAGLLPGTREPSASTATRAKKSSVNMSAASILEDDDQPTRGRIEITATEGHFASEALAQEKGWLPVLGQLVDHGSQRPEHGAARFCQGGARF